MAKAALLKGVYKMNPTQATLKEGSALYRKRVASTVPGYRKVKPPKAIKGR